MVFQDKTTKTGNFNLFETTIFSGNTTSTGTEGFDNWLIMRCFDTCANIAKPLKQS